MRTTLETQLQDDAVTRVEDALYLIIMALADSGLTMPNVCHFE